MSWLSLASAMAAFHRSWRLSMHTSKQQMTLRDTCMLFFWHLFFVASRVIVIVLLCIRFSWIGVGCVMAHWAVMTVWVVSLKTSFCEATAVWQEYAYDMCVGACYVFCFINVKDEPTRCKYFVYYAITLGENFLALFFWYRASPADLWYRDEAVYLVVVCSLVGIVVFQLPYYVFCHPEIGIWSVERNERAASMKRASAAAARRESTQQTMLEGHLPSPSSFGAVSTNQVVPTVLPDAVRFHAADFSADAK